uniref:Isopropylmalate dehydrogenase-like domain-containing protein n=1 Tax=Cyprinus carpio carpio TaxID=630221 RepID=A0A9J7Y8K1_CYPCA
MQSTNSEYGSPYLAVCHFTSNISQQMSSAFSYLKVLQVSSMRLLRYFRLFSCYPPPAEYGGRHTVTLIPGDGIGPELLNHVREIFRFCCVPVDFEIVRVDSKFSASFHFWVNYSIKLQCINQDYFTGNIETNHNLPPSHKSRNNLLRTSLDLYANVMHCQSLPGVPTHHKDIDVIIIRENKEGEYSSLEHENVPGVVESLKIITRVNSLRIAEYAFNLAREKGRRKVTVQISLVLWAAGCPDITFDSMIVDNTTMQLVSKPQHFDMMVMPNLYGNVVSNVCAGLVGGPGLVPGVNYGKDYAVFETEERTELCAYAKMIRKAVLKNLSETQSFVTADLGGQDVTSKVVQSIMQEIQRGGPRTSEQIRT